MISYVRVITAPETYGYFQVPYAVAIYMRQLEAVVRNPELTGLKKLYYPRLEPSIEHTMDRLDDLSFKQEY